MQIITNSESKYRQIFSSILNRSFLIPLSVFQLRVQNIMNYFYIYTLQHAEIKLQIGGSAFFPTGLAENSYYLPDQEFFSTKQIKFAILQSKCYLKV